LRDNNTCYAVAVNSSAKTMPFNFTLADDWKVDGSSQNKLVFYAFTMYNSSIR